MISNEQLGDWVDTLEGDDLCAVCKLDSECNHKSVSGGPNGPIYAPCCDDMSELIDYDKAWEAYVDVMHCDECKSRTCDGCEYQH